MTYQIPEEPEPREPIDIADIPDLPDAAVTAAVAAPRRRRRFVTPLSAATTIVVAVAVVLVAAFTWGNQAPTANLASTVANSQAAVGAPTALGSGVTLTNVSNVASHVVNSIVDVEVSANYFGRQQPIGSGSGVIISSDGYLVTSAHVIESGTTYSVVLTDGTTYDAQVVGMDAAKDVALLKVDATGLSPIDVGSTSGLVVGDPVIAVGNPLDLPGGPSVSTGIISALNRTVQTSQTTLTGIIQTDAAINEGSSGGALLDGNGRLVGITTAVGVSSVGIEGIGFAIPVETVMQVISTLT